MLFSASLELLNVTLLFPLLVTRLFGEDNIDDVTLLCPIGVTVTWLSILEQTSCCSCCKLLPIGKWLIGKVTLFNDEGWFGIDDDDMILFGGGGEECLRINITWDSPPPDIGNQRPVESSRVITCALTFATIQVFDPFVLLTLTNPVDIVVGEWWFNWCPLLITARVLFPFIMVGDEAPDEGDDDSVVDTIILQLDQEDGMVRRKLEGKC